MRKNTPREAELARLRKRAAERLRRSKATPEQREARRVYLRERYAKFEAVRRKRHLEGKVKHFQATYGCFWQKALFLTEELRKLKRMWKQRESVEQGGEAVSLPQGVDHISSGRSG